jgi:hypothetical protein
MWASVFTSGGTATSYVAQVTAVNSGGNQIVLSATAKFGTAPTNASSSRTCYVGGAWGQSSGVANFVQPASCMNTGAITVSTRVNIKAGTYPNTTSSRSIQTTGLATNPLWFRGYKTTPGDQDGNSLGVAGTDIPSITFTTGNLAFGQYTILSNVDITGATVTNGQLYISNNFFSAYHVRVTNTGANSAGIAVKVSGNAVALTNCIFTATGTATEAVLVSGVGFALIGCVVSGGVIGVQNSSSACFINNVFTGQQGDSINLTGSPVYVAGNSIYSPIGNGVNITVTPSSGILVYNNYFDSVNQTSKAGINNTSGTSSMLIHAVANAYYNCTATRGSISEDFNVFDLAAWSSSGFVNGSGGNFAMNPIYQGLGFPGTLETISAYAGYMTHGAVKPNPAKYFAG